MGETAPARPSRASGRTGLAAARRAGLIHLLVEGDNLEALKLLRATHARSVKLAYIDPPYNGGHGFVYRDGRRPAGEWLSFMLPRLVAARELLREDGVLMVSIDDGEAHRLRALLDEVFGEENFCGAFVWEKKRKPSFLDATMGSVTESILAYARDRRRTAPFTAGTVTEGKLYPINNAENPLAVLRFPARSVRFGVPDGRVPPQDMSAGRIVTRLLDPVEVRGGRNRAAFRLEGEWRYSQATLDRKIAAGEEVVIRRLPFRPNVVDRSPRPKKVKNLLTVKGTGTATYEDATAECRALFDGEDAIEYPKPTGLLETLIECASRPGDLVLDFFAGSGSTGHAILNLNVNNVARGLPPRRFVLIELREPVPPRSAARRLGLETLADLCAERVRRVARLHGVLDGGAFRTLRVTGP